MLPKLDLDVVQLDERSWRIVLVDITHNCVLDESVVVLPDTKQWLEQVISEFINSVIGEEIP